MFKIAKPLALIVETPLHAGSGSELGIVDLPIQREKHTNYPKIEASSLKGSLREILEKQKGKNQFPKLEEQYNELFIFPTFGPKEGDEHAGALGFTDARLLLFPVKSMKGVFAWITCPTVLHRLQQDLKLAEKSPPDIDFTDMEYAKIPAASSLFVKPDKIVLEEYTFPVTPDEKCKAFAEWVADNLLPQEEGFSFWKDKMKKDLIVLRDDDFRDFVTMSTEVIPRISIKDETGTVDEGPWYEEYLPADTVLYTLVLASDPFTKNGSPQTAEDVMTFFKDGLRLTDYIIQIGGNTTIGKGLVRTRLF